MVVVTALTTTPDRGIGSFLGQLREAASPVVLVLTVGERLRRRCTPDEVPERVRDWRSLADRVGLESERVVEVDLDHLTDRTASKLAAAVGGERDATPERRRLESAFEQIVEHARKWSDPPSTAEQAELHRAIARLHRESKAWRKWLAPPGGLKDLAGGLKRSADRVKTLLPARLRASPRWLAGGALAGALGCVAAATLVFPGAVAALPVWSAVGAAVGGVLQPKGKGRKNGEGESGATDATDFDQAIRAATLLALLLEVQGHDEAAIGRVLDRALPAESDAIIGSVEAVPSFLSEVRHRADLALQEEART